MTTAGSIIVIPVFSQVLNEYTINKFCFDITGYVNSSTLPGMVFSEQNIADLNRSIIVDFNCTTAPSGRTFLECHIRNLVNTPIDPEMLFEMFPIQNSQLGTFTFDGKVLI